MTKFADLPPEVRKRIRDGQATVVGGAGVRTTGPSTAAAPKAHAWRCFTCRETFPSWAAAQRHATGIPGHRRVEVLFVQVEARFPQ